MQITKLNTQDQLPLTCSRTGTCCHGKMVLLNPWELVCLASEKKMTPKEFRDTYCDFGGIRLKFDGKTGWKDQQSCCMYIEQNGCSVHLGRPLVCRLYPLGRQIQNEKIQYIHHGNEFPCLEGCPEVSELPHLSVKEYLKNQKASLFEKAQDAYLEMVQNIADIAFMLLLDTDLAKSGNKKTLPLWKKMANESPEALSNRIGQEWMDCLTIPDITTNTGDPISFIQRHYDFLQSKAQEKFGSLLTIQDLHEASVLIMGVALHLARAIGADPKTLSEHWIDTAKSHGAME